MVNTIVGIILAGVLGAIAVVIIHETIQGAFFGLVNGTMRYIGPPGVLAAIVPILPVVAGVVVIVLMFMLLTKLT